MTSFRNPTRSRVEPTSTRPSGAGNQVHRSRVQDRPGASAPRSSSTIWPRTGSTGTGKGKSRSNPAQAPAASTTQPGLEPAADPSRRRGSDSPRSRTAARTSASAARRRGAAAAAARRLRESARVHDALVGEEDARARLGERAPRRPSSPSAAASTHSTGRPRSRCQRKPRSRSSSRLVERAAQDARAAPSDRVAGLLLERPRPLGIEPVARAGRDRGTARAPGSPTAA